MALPEAKNSSDLDSGSITSHNEDNNDALDMVFQCSQCNSIVGDSKAWKSTNEILRTVSLQCASNKVRVTEQLLTSKTGDDIGSTYSLLQCEVCQDEIGRMYKTTPSHLDSIRGSYTFYVDKLSSYQVGSNEESSDVHNLSDALTFSDAKRLHQQMQKIQAIVLCLDQRLKCIEKVMSEDVEDIPPQVNSSNNGFDNYTSNPREKPVEHKPQNGHSPFNMKRRANYSPPHGENVASSSTEIPKSINSPELDHLKRKFDKMTREKVSSTSDKKRKRLL